MNYSARMEEAETKVRLTPTLSGWLEPRLTELKAFFKGHKEAPSWLNPGFHLIPPTTRTTMPEPQHIGNP